MKTLEQLLYSLLCISLFASQAVADGPPAFLVGHEQKEKDIARESDAIFIGEFLTLGKGPELDEPGHADFFDAEVKIDQVLKGPLSGKILALYSLETIGEKEEMPEINKSYIFLVEIGQNPTSYQIMKLLPATDKNVGEVKALIGTTH